MRRLALVLALVSLLVCSGQAVAQARSAPPRAVPTRVAVLTMGPGDHPFSRFGHNALLVEWRGQSRVYNFGTFLFEGRKGVEDFLAGRFRYWLSVSSLPATLAHYRAENRTVVAQDLNLTAEERARLVRALEDNARPENRFYDYDYFKDNCTTRVRDALNDVLGGALEQALTGEGRLTYRQHTERLAAENLGLYVALDTALGRHTDQVPRRYEELWVPDVLASGLDDVTLARDTGAEPLVRQTRVLVAAERPPPRSEPPVRAPWFALVGLGLGTAFAGLGVVGAGRRGSVSLRRVTRALYAASVCFVGVATGLVGTVLLGFWFTKHWAAHQNYNLLLLGPWGMALGVTGLRFLLGASRATAHTRALLAWSTGAAALGTLLALLPGSGQDNLRLAALLLPSWAGLWLGAEALARPERATGDKPTLTAAHDLPAAR